MQFSSVTFAMALAASTFALPTADNAIEERGITQICSTATADLCALDDANKLVGQLHGAGTAKASVGTEWAEVAVYGTCHLFAHSNTDTAASFYDDLGKGSDWIVSSCQNGDDTHKQVAGRNTARGNGGLYMFLGATKPAAGS